MGLIDVEDEVAAQRPLPFTIVGRKPTRITSEIEAEIARLYLRTMEEPVPHRLLTILRGRISASKA